MGVWATAGERVCGACSGAGAGSGSGSGSGSGLGLGLDLGDALEDAQHALELGHLLVVQLGAATFEADLAWFVNRGFILGSRA